MKLRLTYDCIILVMKLSTFNSLLVVRVERGVGWLSFPKIGFKIETLVMMISEWLLKSKLLKKVNLKNRSVIELHWHHFSHETIPHPIPYWSYAWGGGSGGFLEDLPQNRV